MQGRTTEIEIVVGGRPFYADTTGPSVDLFDRVVAVQVVHTQRVGAAGVDHVVALPSQIPIRAVALLVDECVVAAAATQRVVAGVAGEEVIALAAEETVPSGPAKQLVVPVERVEVIVGTVTGSDVITGGWSRNLLTRLGINPSGRK